MSDTVSIVVLMKNAAGYLDDLVKALADQKGCGETELVVVDSGSTDGSVSRISSLCRESQLELNLSSVEPRDFGHGKTRNSAVRNARGEIVALLSQDALPASESWLANLIGPLGHDGVAGVFGRQVPRPGTGLCETLFYDMTYPAQHRRITREDASSFSNQNLFFSNVNSALRKSLALEFPFREDLVMSEDQFWGRAMLQQGYALVYEPDAMVIHSHNYSFRQLFKRYFQSGYSLRQMEMQGEIMRGGARTTLMLLKQVLFECPWRLPYAISYEAVQGGAFLCGKYDLLHAQLRESLLK